ncbi:MAG: GNAT family N-acetyltransferase [Flavobacterium sp.]
MITIKQIRSRDTFPVRHPVLRPGKPIEACVFDGDDDKTTVHFGLYEDDVLAGVTSVFKAYHPDIKDAGSQLQLRGMAVQENHQKKGFGEQLILAAEDYARRCGAEILWFNAREVAVKFYERNGYKIENGPFTIGSIGPHYLMYKHL